MAASLLGGPLPNWRFRPLPHDTRSVISGVFMGLAMTVMLQVSERIDTAISGGSMFVVSSIVVCCFHWPGEAFYGFTGGLLVAWINPVFSNLTASGPLSPLYFASNGMHVVSLTLLIWLLKPKARGFRLWEFLVLNQVAGLLDMLPLAWGSRLILDLPWSVAWVQYWIAQPAYFLGGLVAFVLMRRLLKTGLIPSSSMRVTTTRSRRAAAKR